MSPQITIMKTKSKPAVRILEQTIVAGTNHIPSMRSIAEGLRVGQRLHFLREPFNVFDPWALVVADESGQRLGYVSCDCNEILSRLADGGRTLSGFITSVDHVDSWTRIAMEVYLDD